MLFACAYFALGVTGQPLRLHGILIVSYYLEGFIFLTVAVSTPTNSLTHSLFLLWGPGAQGNFTICRDHQGSSILSVNEEETSAVITVLLRPFF